MEKNCMIFGEPPYPAQHPISDREGTAGATTLLPGSAAAAASWAREEGQS